jgi:hypothetical protein
MELSTFDRNRTGNKGLVGEGQDFQITAHVTSQENVENWSALTHSRILEESTWPSELIEEDKVCGETFADIMKFLRGLCLLSDAEQKKQSIHLLEKNKGKWENFLDKSKDYNKHLQILFWITWLYYRTLKNQKLEEYSIRAKSIFGFTHKDETNADFFRGVYNMLSYAFTASNKCNLSKRILTKEVKYIKEDFPNDKSQTISNKMNRIYLANCTGQYQTAIMLIRSINQYLEFKKDIHRLGVCDLREADANIGLKKWKIAKKCLERCIDRLHGQKKSKNWKSSLSIGLHLLLST